MVAMKSSLRRWGIAKGPLDLVLMPGRCYCCWELVETWMLITEMDVAVSESVDSFANVSTVLWTHIARIGKRFSILFECILTVDQPRKIVQTGP